MKHRYSLERKRETDEFIYKHKDEMKRIFIGGTRKEIKKFITDTVRPELGYSAKTSWQDIMCHMSMKLNRMITAGTIP